MADNIIDRLFVILGAKYDDKGVRQWRRGIENARRGVDSAANQLGKFGLAGAAAMGLVGRAVYNFDKEMGIVRGAMKDSGAATDEELKKLEDFIINMASTSQFSSAEIARATGELAKGGLQLKDIYDLLRPTLDFAAAGQINVAEAAYIAAKQLSSFGKDAGDFTGMVDQMARAATSASTTIGDIGRQAQIAGGGMAGLDVDMAEVYATIAKGEAAMTGMSGTALSSLIGQLWNIGAKDEWLKKAGITAEDVTSLLGQGKFLDVFRLLHGTGQWKPSETAFELFEARSGRLANIIVEQMYDTFNKEGERVPGIMNLAANLRTSAAGSAQTIATEALAGFYGDTVKFFSTLEAFQVRLGKAGITDNINRFYDAITALIDYFDNLKPATQELIADGVSAVAALLGVAAALRVVSWLLGGFLLMGPIIAGMTKFAGWVMAFVALWKSYGLAATAGAAFPWLAKIGAWLLGIAGALTAPAWGTAALVVGALASIAGAVWYFWDDIKGIWEKLGPWLADFWDKVRNWWGNWHLFGEGNNTGGALVPSAHGARGSVTINDNKAATITITGATDPEAVAEAVEGALAREWGSFNYRSVVEDLDSGEAAN